MCLTSVVSALSACVSGVWRSEAECIVCLCVRVSMCVYVFVCLFVCVRVVRLSDISCVCSRQVWVECGGVRLSVLCVRVCV